MFITLFLVDMTGIHLYFLDGDNRGENFKLYCSFGQLDLLAVSGRVSRVTAISLTRAMDI